MKKPDAEKVNYRKAEGPNNCDRCRYGQVIFPISQGVNLSTRCNKFGKVAWNKTCDLWKGMTK